MARDLTHGLIVYALLGLGAAGVGWAGLYASQPGATGVAPARWPDVALARDDEAPTLVLFLHPACPCSNATLRELERAYAKTASTFPTRLVVSGDAVDSDLVRHAARLARAPRVELVHDDGALARAFGARTSGTAAVYTADGRLRFFGGLTAARAHDGANHGAAALVASMRGRAPEHAETPVFGCPLEELR